jgi:Rps23 Pro-64 3,4-dihydroxylase Tpa1-like proline 4-hydroxylase
MKLETKVIEALNHVVVENYPFPHFVIDNLLDKESLEDVFNDLAILETSSPTNVYKSEFGEKREWKSFPKNLIGLSNLLHFLSSQEFISVIKKTFAIDEKIEVFPDLTYDGGGYVVSPPGSYLGYHADFNFSSKIGKYRVINILLYMNKDYTDSLGGALHLLDSTSKTVEKMVTPMANKMLGFYTDDHSFHGVGLNRKSFQRRSFNLYYYCDSPISSKQSKNPHKTIWLDVDKHEHD